MKIVRVTGLGLMLLAAGCGGAGLRDAALAAAPKLLELAAKYGKRIDPQGAVCFELPETEVEDGIVVMCYAPAGE